MLPTNNSHYSSIVLLIPTVRAIADHGYITIDGGREERHPSPKRDGRASAPRSPGPRPSPSPAGYELAPRRQDPVPGPADNAFALRFLPPTLSLVYPALYLSASILILLTPARNSTSLLAPPPHLPPTGTTTSTTSAALTPGWTRRWRTTEGGPPSTRRRRPLHPKRGGGGRRTQRPVTPGITQPLGQVPLHGHLSSSVVGGVAHGGNCGSDGGGSNGGVDMGGGVLVCVMLF